MSCLQGLAQGFESGKWSLSPQEKGRSFLYSAYKEKKMVEKRIKGE